MDNALEFTRQDLQDHFSKIGADLVYSHPYANQMNGVSERMNQTIVKLGRALLISAGLQTKFWGEAVRCVIFIQNIVNTCPATGKSPYEMIYKAKPKISHLQPFGARCIYYDTIVNKVNK